MTEQTALLGQTSTAVVLRVEAVPLLLAALVAFQALDGSWLWFAILFLAPDLFMLGYLRGPKVGAVVYNVAHTYVTPAILGGIWWFTQEAQVGRVAALWTAHIAFDRLLGYGLKDSKGFKHTHLQRV